ncbi:hypothetical protein EU527_07220 [Candidatus Thorarchaeota archaeon]|nr:MAG: hypothetical protein EU527_07220 [Candidatus Thorarchaeota archaeon]
MPSLLITTSRRTSNRVRTFARDLWSVLPGSERFNRGSMSVEELISRIRQSGAKGALIISIWKGNPRELTLLSPQGDEILKIRIDSALLRRETNQTFKGRLDGIESICVKSGSSSKVVKIAEDFASILDLSIQEHQNPIELETETNKVALWFDDVSGGKILWTHYATRDVIEIGPRIRISTVWRGTENESE